FYGIGDIDVVKKNLYKVGDTVLVSAAYNDTGMASYYITDYVRTKSLKILFFLFVAILLIVGRWKGFRSMLALSISFFVILKFIVPKIIAGSNPILITLIGSLIIFIASIYITEGFSKISHIAIVSVTISLAITIFLSWLFVELSKLSGLANEEAGSLIMVGQNMLNFKGLLLAGIIIGALGVLDDVVISQAATVEEIHRTDPGLSKKALFERAFRVGLSHISSMTNTLFLAYAGVSLPLIILFTTGQSAMNSYAQIINNEDIATEIVRTLAASVGLILAVPIATFVAVWWFKKGQQTTKNISH
ncbi:MAG: YibE/F family protein, partial [Candidatus Falkowbacteria bacterium]|nr:YibE/F family protein [Candidatus Falkowbacteria bacterium]